MLLYNQKKSGDVDYANMYRTGDVSVVKSDLDVPSSKFFQSVNLTQLIPIVQQAVQNEINSTVSLLTEIKNNLSNLLKMKPVIVVRDQPFVKDDSNVLPFTSSVPSFVYIRPRPQFSPQHNSYYSYDYQSFPYFHSNNRNVYFP